MRRPPLTAKVLEGLGTLAELARSFREADMTEDADGSFQERTLDKREQSEADAAAAWIDKARRWHAERSGGGKDGAK